MRGMIGKRLGGYLIEHQLGKGGMGVVYGAKQVELNRRVALKILPPQFTMDAGFVRRFRREARAIAQLNHPNIVQIYDIGEQEGMHYYAMELVEGETLDDRVFRKNRLSLYDAVRTVVQVCRGLHAAHEAGIIHRDVKPANILYDRQGHVKVMDFGIALQRTAERMTTMGAIIGTPEYMSPEQAIGKTVTPQSDIYSLGVVLYEMVTGRVPFENRDAMTTLQQHEFDEPRRPTEVNPDLPVEVEQIILKMLAKEPEARYQSCADVIADLRAVVKGDSHGSSASRVFSTGAPGRPVRVVAGSRWGMLLGGGAVAAGTAGLVVFLLGRVGGAAPTATRAIRPAVVRPVADSEVYVGLLSVYEAHTAIRRQATRAQVRLRHGGVLAGAEARFDGEEAVLTLADGATVRLPREVLGEDRPVQVREDAGDPAVFRRESRAWARDVYETWKLDNQVDFVKPDELPALLEGAARRLPPLHVPPYAAALAQLAAVSGERDAARAALAAAEQELGDQRAGAPDAGPQFADRVVLLSGRELRCRVLDDESDFEALRVELPSGGRMRVPFTEVRHVERAYGQAAAAADRARESVRVHRERLTGLKKRVHERRRTMADVETRYRAAVEAVVAAVPPAPDATEPSEDAGPIPAGDHAPEPQADDVGEVT